MSWPVYTIDDLRSGLNLAPKAILAVFGDPVKHSRSPQMHNPGLAARGISGQYIRLHIRPEEFTEAIKRCADLGFVGVNCTIPHKFAALEAVTTVDPLAQRLGAVNTIVFKADGSTAGFNSDGPGLLRAVREMLGLKLRDQRILILGAGGGAGRAAAIQCALESCPRLFLLNRTREKIEALAREMSDFYPQDRISLLTEPDLTEVDLVINATSVGMKPDDPLLLPSELIEPRHAFYDMIYSPPETALLAQAKAKGAHVANGFSMLLHQGAVSFEKWFPEAPAPLEAMRHGLESSLRE